ncbi:glutaredoxin family protein [Candidatus Bathyarchaeota archaeon]|nr:glutaredoxin family protein [Candidatus Bathyarchaeota archaeon]
MTSWHVNDGVRVPENQLTLNQGTIITISGDKMQTVKVPGRNNKHQVLVYAISTCGWCKRAKKFLNDNNIGYEYIDVDVCNWEDKNKIMQDIKSRGGRLAYPTLIIDNKILLTGASPDKLREVLEI